MSMNNNIESLELEPTTINLLQSFNQDTVRRNHDLMHFIRLLDSYKKNTIAVDSSWGNGKTFFVKQTKLLLDFILKIICLMGIIRSFLWRGTMR